MSTMRLLQILLFAKCAWFALGLSAFAADADRRELEFFEKKIRPVLAEHCYECHSAGAKRLQAALRLDTREAIRRGGDSGPAVVPGDVDNSLILDALRYESFEMPPKGKLPDMVIADFERWIRRGAADPREADPPVARPSSDLQKPGDFWSFRPPKQSSIPNVSQPEWPRTPIDRFVLARLEAAGIEPVADADRETLIRRAWFSLIGLPPPPHEVEAFLADRSPDAFAKVVDRLLASPHFGERWGRHWLDVVRFAESSGGGRTRIFPEAWRYRDCVVDSFNRDKPFDQFASEQIAGDLLSADSVEQERDQLVATAFLVLGPTNYELQDKVLLRMEVVDEQIDTIGRAFLGMTIGCARCHDHKFDPIPTADYYALAGILRSTKTLTPGNVSGFVERPLPVDEELQQALKEHRATVEPLQKRMTGIRQQLKQLDEQLAGNPASPNLSKLAGIVVDDAQATRTGTWVTSQSVRPFVGDGYLHDGNTAKGERRITFTPNLPGDGRYEVRVSYTPGTNRATNALVTVRHAEGEASSRINQRRKPALDGLFASVGEFRFAAAGNASVTISNDATDGHVIADAVQFLPVDAAAVAEKEKPEANIGETDKRIAVMRAERAKQAALLKSREAELTALATQAPPEPPLVMAVAEEKPEEIGDCAIHIRGNVRNLGESVPRGVLSVAAVGESPRFEPTGSGRRELARWIAHQQNPLTARVFVNRVWHHLFGAGLVRTVDNFGTVGERPSHPELLDWLAVRFVEQGWSTKALIRQIMLSRVYQLSSGGDSKAAAVDPENRLLWRMNRRRSDAEAIRDAVLAVSGRLETEIGGPNIPRGTSSEFGYEFKSRRRSVYVPVFRNTLHDLFAVFDAADPNLVTGRRNTSTLPTQALYLMNSPFVQDEARQTAEWVVAVDGLDDAGRLDLLYRTALGRSPRPAETELSLQFVNRVGETPAKSENSRLEAWTNVCQALFSCIDFRYLY